MGSFDAPLLVANPLRLIYAQFDLTDPLTTFRRETHARLPASDLLKRSIFALSSRHLACLGKFDPLKADEYQQHCLQLLIPLLGETSARHDDNLLASTMMLRVTEELQGNPRTSSRNPLFIL